MTTIPFTGDRFRVSAAKVLTHLTSEDTEALESRYGSAEDLLAEMTVRGRSASATIARRGQVAAAVDHDLLAAAVLSVRPTLRVQESSIHVAEVYEKLVAQGVPVELAVAGRLLEDQALTGLLVATAQVAVAVDATATHPMFVTMVTAALLHARGLDLPDAVMTVHSVLTRAGELAGRYRAGLTPADGEDPRFPVLGNADLVGQVAAYRVAVAEAVGAHVPPIAEVADKVALRLRRALSRAPGQSYWRSGNEPDIVLVFQAFANLIGGGAEVEEVFRCLHRELTALSLRPDQGIPVRHGFFESGGPADTMTAVVDEDETTARLFDALYAGAGPRHAVVTAWITGARRPDDPFELPFLIDRVRRVAVRRRRGPTPSPEPGLREAYRILAARVHDAFLLSGTGAGIAEAVLPPLWTNRCAAVNLVRSKLRVRLGRGATTRAKAALVAAAIVRGPTQGVRGTSPGRQPVCACGARGRRTPSNRTEVAPEQACPHRPWAEWGVVEDYRTLTEFAEFASTDATRAQLRRYRGPWEQWIDELR